MFSAVIIPLYSALYISIPVLYTADYIFHAKQKPLDTIPKAGFGAMCAARRREVAQEHYAGKQTRTRFARFASIARANQDNRVNRGKLKYAKDNIPSAVMARD